MHNIASQIVLDESLRAALFAAFNAFFVFWVTEGVKSLSAVIASWSDFFPPLKYLDISGLGSVVVAFLVSIAMYGVDQALGVVPSSFGMLAPFVVQVIIAVLAMGMHTIVSKHNAALRGF
jgi:hypothetical protein